MSLPVIKTFAGCTDFSTTVTPFIPQLYDLPQQIFRSITNPSALKQLYISTNPLISAFAFSLFLFPIFLIVSEVNKNYSEVDRCWSLLPTVYNVHFVIYAHAAGLSTRRLDSLLVCSVIWSMRLTYNYWRKGGYQIGSEDYRWEVLREKISPPLFFVFNVLFISLAQSILLFTISMPTYVMVLAARFTEDKYQASDILFSLVLVDLVLAAYFADEQQWKYQSAKKVYQKNAKVPSDFHQEELDRGFNTTGLWSLSRHPNFAAEQGFWVVLYAWSCWTTETYYNWSVVGAVSYLILFQASTWFTELITAKKYPDYREYQQRVGKFLPNITSGLPGNFSDKRVSKSK